MKSNLIHAVILSSLCLLGLNYANAEEYSVNDIDKAIAGTNRLLPMTLAQTINFESVKRDKKTIYYIYGYQSKDNYYRAKKNIKKLEDSLLPTFCNLDFQKQTMNIGYSYIFLYAPPEKEDTFKVIADKDVCAKYW